MSEYRMALREKILHAALREFRAKGIKAVKMDDIAASLSVSKRTVYELYANKEDLLLEVAKKADADKQRQTANHVTKSTMDVLIHELQTKIEEMRTTNPLFYSDMEHYPKLLDYFRHQKEANRTLFIDFLKRGEQEGYFCRGLDYELIASLMDEQGEIIMSRQLYKHYPMQDILFNALHISIRGLCTPKGIEMMDKFMEKELRK